MPILLLAEIRAHWMVQILDDLKQNHLAGFQDTTEICLGLMAVALSAHLYTNSKPKA